MMHSTSGVCVWCLASNGTNLYGTMMYGGWRSNPNSLQSSSCADLPFWAYYAHGRQRRCQEDPVSPPPADWIRQPGRPRITWLSTVQQDLKHHLTLPEAADLAQNRPLWRMMSTYGAMQSWSCMPETSTTMTHAHVPWQQPFSRQTWVSRLFPDFPSPRQGSTQYCFYMLYAFTEWSNSRFFALKWRHASPKI